MFDMFISPNNMEAHGKFVISLDFELFWGVRDKKNLNQYGENVKNVHCVVPRLLDLFDKYKINVTFSTVGLLFCKTKSEIISSLPLRQPLYLDSNLSPYNGYIDKIGHSHIDDPYHYGSNLISAIIKHQQHEIGTHTFSHYYCLEPGQTTECFKADLDQAIVVAKNWGIRLESLVFPRNQFNHNYLEICRCLGIVCYRGNGESWLYTAKGSSDESEKRRGLRFLDSYINISGPNCYSDKYMSSGPIKNIPASRFLRPYTHSLRLFDGLRLKRIHDSMSYAAQTHTCFHLWWHPHNFGRDLVKNLLFLERILVHYRHLSAKYGFKSYTMSGLAKNL
jgi:peptidoglycan/xylan/chitin deacetylase (PgdA/CDA1 family)